MSFHIHTFVQTRIHKSKNNTNHLPYHGVGSTVEELGVLGLIIEAAHHV